MFFKKKEYKYHINFFGKHFAMNSMAVLAACSALGIDMNNALLSIEQTAPIKGRGLIKKVKGPNGGVVTLIDDCYNANPSSMTASLQVLGTQKANRHIAVLGEMKELGVDGERMHIDLLEPILQNKIEKIFTIGSLMRYLYDILPTNIQGKHCQNIEELTNELKSYLSNDDVVLVKGSNSVGLNKVVEALDEKI